MKEVAFKRSVYIEREREKAFYGGKVSILRIRLVTTRKIARERRPLAHRTFTAALYIEPFQHDLSFDFQVETEGLTGQIKFNDEGRRQNYTLDVVEMTVNSAPVKVSFYSSSSFYRLFLFLDFSQIDPFETALSNFYVYFFKTLMIHPSVEEQIYFD